MCLWHNRNRLSCGARLVEVRGHQSGCQGSVISTDTLMMLWRKLCTGKHACIRHQSQDIIASELSDEWRDVTRRHWQQVSRDRVISRLLSLSPSGDSWLWWITCSHATRPVELSSHMLMMTAGRLTRAGCEQSCYMLHKYITMHILQRIGEHILPPT